MISVSNKKYEEIKINKNKVEKLRQDYNFSEIISKIIITRNFDNEEIYNINNDLNLNNVFLKNKDYEKSLNIFLETIKKKQKICILGDYDVDGSCATSLLVRYFNHINQQHFFYIPDRVNDGYGPSKKA